MLAVCIGILVEALPRTAKRTPAADLEFVERARVSDDNVLRGDGSGKKRRRYRGVGASTLNFLDLVQLRDTSTSAPEVVLILPVG